MTQIEILLNEIKTLRAELINLKLIQGEYPTPKDDNIKAAYLVLCRMFYGDISLKSRKREMVQGRQFFYNYVRLNTKLSLSEMSHRLCQMSLNPHGLKNIQDHSTVIHALEEFEKFYIMDKKYKAQYDEFINKLESELTI